MAGRPFGPCRLCGEPSALCRSHVVPEWMYEKAKLRAGYFISASRHPRHRPKKFQTGRWEYLLCQSCEGDFSRVEGLAKAEVERILRTRWKGGKTLVVPDADPAPLLRFGWSVLWRASVSTDYSVRNVDLDGFEEELRADLLDGDLDPARYPMLIVRPDGSDYFARSLTLPHPFKLFDLRANRMSGFGLSWAWTTSRKRAGWIRETSNIPWLGLDREVIVIPHKTDDEEFLTEMGRVIREDGFL